MGPAKVYAVRVGRQTGIFNTWKEVSDLVMGYAGAKHKSFSSVKEATEWLQAPQASTTFGGPSDRSGAVAVPQDRGKLEGNDQYEDELRMGKGSSHESQTGAQFSLAQAESHASHLKAVVNREGLLNQLHASRSKGLALEKAGSSSKISAGAVPFC
jgi:Caulimovirus viroplasmin